MNKFYKVILTLLALSVAGVSMYVVTRGPKTDLDVHGDKYYQQSAYSTKEDVLRLKEIEDELSKEKEQVAGNKALENEAEQKSEKKKVSYYFDLYSRNTARFKKYQEQLIHQLEKIESDKYLFRDYVLFTSYAQNKKFLEAAELLKTIETKLNIKLLDE